MELYFLSDDLLFGLGDYYFVNDQEDAALCVKTTVICHILRTSLLVSSICLSLSFIYQCMEPRSTCCKKCFLCYNISLVVSCSWYTYTRYISGLHWTLSQVEIYLKLSIGYLSYKASATWLTVTGYEIWQSFASLNYYHRRSQSNRRFVYYSIAGWGIPIVLLSFVLIINYSTTLQKYLLLKPDVGLAGWLHDRKTAFAFHYGPMQILYCLNGIFFICTIYQIRKATETTQIVKNRSKYQLLRISLKLAIVMGIFWTFECILWIMRWFTIFPIRYISDGILGLQGMVFFGLTTFKKQTPGLLREKIEVTRCNLQATVDRIKQNFG